MKFLQTTTIACSTIFLIAIFPYKGICNMNRKYCISINDTLKVLKILKNKVEILIPTSFILMKEELIKSKYPSGNRPTEVYTNERASVNIAFNHTQNNASMADLPAIKDLLTKQLTKDPKSSLISSQIKKINGKDFVLIEIITQAIDSKIYNLMFVTVVENKVLLSTFNCTEMLAKEWEPVAKQIVNTVKIIK